MDIFAKTRLQFKVLKAILIKGQSYAKNIDNVPVIKKDGNIVNAKYALAKFTVEALNMYDSPDLSNKYTTIAAGSYSTDAAFLDYNDSNNNIIRNMQLFYHERNKFKPNNKQSKAKNPIPRDNKGSVSFACMTS